MARGLCASRRLFSIDQEVNARVGRHLGLNAAKAGLGGILWIFPAFFRDLASVRGLTMLAGKSAISGRAQQSCHGRCSIQETIMKRNSAILAAGFAAMALAALALTPAIAGTGLSPDDPAIKACSTVNPLQPVSVVSSVADTSGIGFSLVWLSDKENNLWLCDADAEGKVYSYSLMTSDLLAGGGPELIGLQLASDGGLDGEPQVIAEKVCVAYLTDGGEVVASEPDGLDLDPGFVVFVKDEKGGLHLCNATGDAAVWAFEPIGDPLSFDGKQEIS
jgi:hypothetical protein